MFILSFLFFCHFQFLPLVTKARILNSATQNTKTPEFGEKWRTTLVLTGLTSSQVPSASHAGYRVKLKKVVKMSLNRLTFVHLSILWEAGSSQPFASFGCFDLYNKKIITLGKYTYNIIYFIFVEAKKIRY